MRKDYTLAPERRSLMMPMCDALLWRRLGVILVAVACWGISPSFLAQGADKNQSLAKSPLSERSSAVNRRDDRSNHGGLQADDNAKVRVPFQAGYDFLSSGLAQTKSPVVEGSVKDEQGRPIAGAIVGIGPYGLLPRQWNVLTDDNGQFEMKVWPQYDPDSICVYAEGCAAIRIPLKWTSDRIQVPIVLKTGSVIRGRAVSSDRRPLQDGVVLFVAYGDQHPHQLVQFCGTTDLVGRFSWSGVTNQNVAVFIGKPGFQTGVFIGRPRDVEFQVELQPTVTARELEHSQCDGNSHVYAYFVEGGERKVNHPLHLLEIFDGPVVSATDLLYPRILDRGHFQCYRGVPIIGGSSSDFNGLQMDMPTSAWMPKNFETVSPENSIQQ